jgi:hypothetical protein
MKRCSSGDNDRDDLINPENLLLQIRHEVEEIPERKASEVEQRVTIVNSGERLLIKTGGSAKQAKKITKRKSYSLSSGSSDTASDYSE